MPRLSRIRIAMLVGILGLAPSAARAQYFGFGWGGGGRYNTSYSPFLNVYNGQTSLLQIQSFNWYPTNLQVVQAGGSVAFVPQYQPIPQGLNYPVRAVVSGNGLYTRYDLAPTFGGAGIGPPQPQTTFITPVFAGGAQGRSVPFTTVLYPPSFNTTTINTSVWVPAGGAAYVGGYRTQIIGRNQWGAPVWGRVPYVNPAFQNRFFFGGGNANAFWAPGVFWP